MGTLATRCRGHRRIFLLRTLKKKKIARNTSPESWPPFFQFHLVVVIQPTLPIQLQCLVIVCRRFYRHRMTNNNYLRNYFISWADGEQQTHTIQGEGKPLNRLLFLVAPLCRATSDWCCRQPTPSLSRIVDHGGWGPFLSQINLSISPKISTWNDPEERHYWDIWKLIPNR